MFANRERGELSGSRPGGRLELLRAFRGLLWPHACTRCMRIETCPGVHGHLWSRHAMRAQTHNADECSVRTLYPTRRLADEQVREIGTHVHDLGMFRDACKCLRAVRESRKGVRPSGWENGVVTHRGHPCTVKRPGVHSYVCGGRSSSASIRDAGIGVRAHCR